MNELIPIKYDSNRITISARNLHEFLEVKTNFRDWFPRMTEYGLEEGDDFNPLKNERVQIEGNREVTREIQDYQLTLDAAKEIAMIQRNEKGKQARKYFIQVEKQWNDPQAIIARALKLANNKIEELLTQREDDKPKIEFYDEFAESKNAVEMSKAAKVLNIPGIGRTKLFQILRDEHILRSNNEPYQRFIDNGHFRVAINSFQHPSGDRIQYTKTLVLPRGLNHIRKLIERIQKQ